MYRNKVAYFGMHCVFV